MCKQPEYISHSIFSSRIRGSLQRNVGASRLIKWPVMEDLVVPHNGCMQIIDSHGLQHAEPLGGCTFLSNSAIVFAW